VKKKREHWPGISPEEKARKAVAKYLAKTEPGRVKSIIDDMKPGMLEKYRKSAVVQRLVDSATGRVIDKVGVPTAFRVYYLAFGREVYGRWRRFGARALTNELALVRIKWINRGFSLSILDRVETEIIATLEKEKVPKE